MNKVVEKMKDIVGIRSWHDEEIIEVSDNPSFEQAFPEFHLLKDKVSTLQRYKAGISDKEIYQLFNDFNVLYDKLQALPLHEKEEAKSQLIKAIICKEKDIQKQIDSFHHRQLEAIKRKVNRMINKT